MSIKKQGAYYAGTSGLVLPVRNLQAAPPEFHDKGRLAYYASVFNSLEINSSFYKLPMPKTVARWAESVPDNFRFTFKLWKDITHTKLLAFEDDAVHKFMEIVNHAGNKKGCLLIQFPPKCMVTENQLERLLCLIRKNDLKMDWRIAVEFRNHSWYQKNIYKIINAYKAVVVMHDMPKSLPPEIKHNTDFVYLRYHGPGGTYRGSYTDEFLKNVAQQINRYRQKGKDVYVYFNNTMGDAVKNLMDLNKYVALSQYQKNITRFP
jgi:uncharacterized protein YecE (DUF72 family)